MRMLGRWRFSIQLGPVVAAVIFANACTRPSAAAVGAEPISVAAVKAERADVAQTLMLPGEFHPFQEIDVYAKVAGFLNVIYVDVGDRVSAGQLLATLDVPELQAQTSEDQASIRRSTEEINRATADMVRAESAHQVAHLAAARLMTAFRSRPDLVAQQDIDDAAGRDRIAEAQVTTAKAAVAGAEEQLAVLRAGADKTQTLLGYTRIAAPFAGVVTRRYADTGVMIQAGTSSSTQAIALVKLSQNDRLRLNVAVPESAVSHIRVGQRVDVRVDAFRRAFSGTIARFARTVNVDTRTMQTEVDVANPDWTIVPGMRAYVSIPLERSKHALTVPVQAVDRAGRSATVYVVTNEKVEPRPVTLGLEAPDRVEILAGLRDGDLVVVGNRSQLQQGLPVSPKLIR
jgi:RND family efflux transporter MFP subunit